jgi:SAM-dependent methyltransferase
VDLDTYRRRNHETWGRMAAGWEHELLWMWNVTRPVGEALVAMLEPERGQTILELAAGSGETGFAAAAQLGEGGKLITCDLGFDAIQAARLRAAQLGLDNIEFRVMDSQRMDLDDDSVDGVLCRWGYLRVEDPATALAQTRRVLREGGRLSFSVWADPDRNPWAAIPGRALAKHGDTPAPRPGAPGEFAMADGKRIEVALGAAGFGSPLIQEMEIEWRFRDLDAYWSALVQLDGALGQVMAGLDERDRAQVCRTIEHKADRYRQDDGGYAFPGVALNAVAS